MATTLFALVGGVLFLNPVGERSSSVARVHAKFEKVAIEIFEGYFRDLSAAKKRELSQELNLDKKAIPTHLGKMILHSAREAFAVTPREAERILEGRFRNRANREKSTKALEVFGELGIELPDIIKILQPIVKKGRDLKLEFATRLLHFHLKKLARALNQE